LSPWASFFYCCRWLMNQFSLTCVPSKVSICNDLHVSTQHSKHHVVSIYNHRVLWTEHRAPLHWWRIGFNGHHSVYVCLWDALKQILPTWVSTLYYSLGGGVRMHGTQLSAQPKLLPEEDRESGIGSTLDLCSTSEGQNKHGNAANLHLGRQTDSQNRKVQEWH